MDNNDRLKEVLEKIDNVNAPIDLEDVVMKAIREQESVNNRIASYKAKAYKALTVSVILTMTLGILFSLSSNVHSIEHYVITYSSIILVLIILFIQLEMGRTKIFENHKNMTI